MGVFKLKNTISKINNWMDGCDGMKVVVGGRVCDLEVNSTARKQTIYLENGQKS